MTTRLIPLGIYFNAEQNNFYHVERNQGMGPMFFLNWECDKDRFPKSKDEAFLYMKANMDQTPQPRAERPTSDEFQDAITVLFDMAAKQANPKVRQSYIQVGAWLRDYSTGA